MSIPAIKFGTLYTLNPEKSQAVLQVEHDFREALTALEEDEQHQELSVGKRALATQHLLTQYLQQERNLLHFYTGDAAFQGPLTNKDYFMSSSACNFTSSPNVRGAKLQNGQLLVATNTNQPDVTFWDSTEADISTARQEQAQTGTIEDSDPDTQTGSLVETIKEILGGKGNVFSVSWTEIAEVVKLKAMFEGRPIQEIN